MKLQNDEQLLTPGKFNIIEYARRSLWRDMAVWTRAYLTSVNEDQEYQDAVFKKWYSIPSNFGTLLNVVFGAQIGEQYANLVSQHIVILREIISAMISGDQNAVNENVANLYKNADDRAAFLAQVNPYWSESVLLSYLYQYIELVLNSITTFLTKDYDTNIKIYDRLMYHTTLMADYFSDGLLKYIIESGNQVSVT